jgi:hypothetical protein
VVTRAWSAAARQGRTPTGDELARAVSAVSQPNWRLNPATRTATHLSDTPLAMNSFVKSYIMDRAVDAAGLTLNHQEWFAKQQKTAQFKGTMDRHWLAGSVAQLQVVEHFRSKHNITKAYRCLFFRRLGRIRVHTRLPGRAFGRPAGARRALAKLTGAVHLRRHFHDKPPRRQPLKLNLHLIGEACKHRVLPFRQGSQANARHFLGGFVPSLPRGVECPLPG